MRVLACGGRDYADRETVWNALGRFGFCVTVLVHGAAPGADTLARQWADFYRRDTDPYPAAWKAHGKAAGPIRNQRMIDEGKPDLVIAFPGGRGTWDMVQKARGAGIRVVEVSP